MVVIDNRKHLFCLPKIMFIYVLGFKIVYLLLLLLIVLNSFHAGSKWVPLKIKSLNSLINNLLNNICMNKDDVKCIRAREILYLVLLLAI